MSLFRGHVDSSPCGCLGCQGRNSARREAFCRLNTDAVYMSVNRALYRPTSDSFKRQGLTQRRRPYVSPIRAIRMSATDTRVERGRVILDLLEVNHRLPCR
jgi:hypothetical protein